MKQREQYATPYFETDLEDNAVNLSVAKAAASENTDLQKVLKDIMECNTVVTKGQFAQETLLHTDESDPAETPHGTSSLQTPLGMTTT